MTTYITRKQLIQRAYIQYQKANNFTVDTHTDLCRATICPTLLLKQFEDGLTPDDFA